MLARRYQNYPRAVMRAAQRRRRRRVDVDVQRSLDGTPWALHWPTIGRNKLHDPAGVFGPGRRIDSLTDQVILRLRGPKGQRPWRLLSVLQLAAQHRVAVEAEAKVQLREDVVQQLVAPRDVAAMLKRGHLVVKTLAFMGAPRGPVNRLRPWHRAGVPTMLSFTGFRKRGISKAAAWPVTDFVRGRAKWTP